MGKHKRNKKVTEEKKDLVEVNTRRRAEEEEGEIIRLEKEGILNLECGKNGLSYFLPYSWRRDRNKTRPKSKYRSKFIKLPKINEDYNTEAVVSREIDTFYERTRASILKNQEERDDLSRLRKQEATKQAKENRERLQAEKQGKLALKKARKREFNIVRVRSYTYSSSDDDQFYK